MRAIVIGTSAGGIEALKNIFSMLPELYSLPIIVVLHIPEGRPSKLSEIFKNKTKMVVKEAEDKEQIRPGTIYFAPPDFHLLIESNLSFSFSSKGPVHFSRPSIDYLFESAADVFGKSLIGILLTGANRDGELGLKKIKETGGLTMIQDPITAEFPMMPLSGMNHVKPEHVLSLNGIGKILLNYHRPNPLEKEIEKLKILIVDDLQDNLLALEALIRRQDVEIFKCLSGSQALESMIEHEFCLAIIDVQMPAMSGFELAELMRGTKKTKNIPIIFVSATAKEQSYSFAGYESGAVDFLIKPLDTHAVINKVNIFIELGRQKVELKKQLETIEHTQDELRQAVLIRDEFMSIASHELKTPLTSLKLQSQLRKRYVANNNTAAFSLENLTKMFNADEKQFERITHLIDDMLDVSRINSGKLTMNLEQFDLCDLAKEVVEHNSEQFKLAGSPIEIKACESTIGVWDRFRIEQVITNLLTNAFRYGDKKPISLEVNASEIGAQIIVQDHGRGIALENHDRIFQRFERGGMGNEISGLGLGLYIVRQILEAHHGTIKVESELGKGSTFTVELPYGK